MATLLIRPAEGGSGEKKRRSRKGKNAQKKQPQRGLGVAQLEKLRLQEQSLLCQPSPNAYSLRLCSGPGDHPLACCDNDAAQTILSLTTSDVHFRGAGRGFSCGSVVRAGQAGVVSRLSTLSGHSSAQSCVSQAATQEMSRGRSADAAAEAAQRAIASRAVGCLSQSSKFTSPNASLFSNVLTPAQLQTLDNHAAQAQQKLEERRAAATGGDQEVGNGRPYIYAFNKEAGATGISHVNDAGFKLHPVFKDHVSGRKRPWIALQDSAGNICPAQLLDLNAPVGENDVVHSDRPGSARQSEAPDDGAGAHYTTGIVRSALGNSCLSHGSKIRVCSSSSPWQESDSPSPVSAYFPDVGGYSENGVTFRPCPLKDSCSSASGWGKGSAYVLNPRSGVNDHSEIYLPLPEKESICSNFLTLGISSSISGDRHRWSELEESTQDNSLMSSNDVSKLKQQQQQDSTISACEGDNHASQIRNPGCKQEVGVDLEGCPSRCFPFDYGRGNYQRKNPMLLADPPFGPPSNQSCGFPSSVPPLSIASTKTGINPGTARRNLVDYDHEPPAKFARPVEDVLDLRLKL